MSTYENCIESTIEPLIVRDSDVRPVPTGWAPPEALIEEEGSQPIITTTLGSSAG